MKTILLFSLCLIFISTAAQERTKFSTQNFIGLMEGEDGSAFQVQSINGMKYKTWFAGLGAGLDWYFLRSIPVFASLNKSFFERNRKSLFISADGGLNIPWVQGNYSSWEYSNQGEFSNGAYFSSGVGYRIGVGKNSDAIILHLGYSYKHTSQKVTVVYPCFTPPCPENVDVYDFHLRRLSLRVGWSF